MLPISLQLSNIKETGMQNLSSLITELKPIESSASTHRNPTGYTGIYSQNIQAKNTTDNIKVLIVEILPQGRIVARLPTSEPGFNSLIELELPEEMKQAVLQNPDLLKLGITLTLPKETQAKFLVTPATELKLSQDAQRMKGEASLSSPTPLTNPFPTGSISAAIARITRLAIPGAESESSPASFSSSQVLSSTHLPSTLPIPLAEAIFSTLHQQTALAPAIASLLAALPELEKMANKSSTDEKIEEIISLIHDVAGSRSNLSDLSKPDMLQKALQNSGIFFEAKLASLLNKDSQDGLFLEKDLKSVLLSLQKSLEGQGATNLQGEKQNYFNNLTPYVQGAIERIKTFQFLSMPDHPEITQTGEKAQPFHLTLSIPIAPNGMQSPTTAMLGMFIEYNPEEEQTHPQNKNSEGEQGDFFPWKVKFALDINETGPIQAEVRLRGNAISATIWVEKSELANVARDELKSLSHALKEAAFDVKNLEIKNGMPHISKVAQKPNFDVKL